MFPLCVEVLLSQVESLSDIQTLYWQMISILLNRLWQRLKSFLPFRPVLYFDRWGSIAADLPSASMVSLHLDCRMIVSWRLEEQLTEALWQCWPERFPLDPEFINCCQILGTLESVSMSYVWRTVKTLMWEYFVAIYYACNCDQLSDQLRSW